MKKGIVYPNREQEVEQSVFNALKKKKSWICIDGICKDCQFREVVCDQDMPINDKVKAKIENTFAIQQGYYKKGKGYVDNNGKLFRVTEWKTSMNHEERVEVVETMLADGKTEDGIVETIKGFKWKDFNEKMTRRQIQFLKNGLK